MNNSYEVKYSSACVIKSFSIKNVMVCRPKTLIGKIERNGNGRGMREIKTKMGPHQELGKYGG
jgi:hypothetical protein